MSLLQKPWMAVALLVAFAPSSPSGAQCLPGRSTGHRGLAVGDPAPGFSLPGSDGKTYTLASFKGKQVVVLAWFAKAFTGG